MPAKNTIRYYAPDSYYHVYNRGNNKQLVFLDNFDRDYFMRLIRRYIDPADNSRRADNQVYAKFDVEITAYCLMGNHFHLLLKQNDDERAVAGFMKSLQTAYSMYFNLKYHKVGRLFQGVFKASLIGGDSYLTHITRYIHMNPRDWENWPYSSLPEYLGRRRTSYIKPLETDMTPRQYLEFCRDYQNEKGRWEDIKSELANK